MVFGYTDKILKQIPKVLSEVSSLKVKSLSRVKNGEVNYNFRVNTDTKPVIVRVFRYGFWPKEETLRLVEEKLKELGIKQSRIIYFDNSDKYFPNGFMVGEWIEGVSGKKAIKQRMVTEKEVIEKTARILKKVHTVQFKKFGTPPFNQQNKGINDFSNWVLGLDGEDRLGRLIEKSLISKELVNDAQKKLQAFLDRIDFSIEPVMVHGDAGPENIIWTKEGPILVDWDDMKATSWSYDLAWLTFWYDWQANKVVGWFLKGYGASNINLNEFRLLEKISHLMLALKLLPYYAFDIQDKERLTSGIKKVERFLSTMRSW